MRYFQRILFISIGFLSFLVSCSAENSSDKNQLDLSSALVVDGIINDESFNQGAWEGLQMARDKYGYRVSFLEANSTNYKASLEDFREAGYSVIWAVGFRLAEAVEEAARLNPNQNYGLIDVAYEGVDLSNLQSFVFRIEEASFLAGYMAALHSKTGTIGFVGGIPGKVIDAFHFGFLAGAHYANPEVNVLVQYAESFSDPAKGRQIASLMFSRDADIIYQAAGATGNGVIEAAKESGKWVIGVDRDQSYLAPQNVLFSVIKRVDLVIEQTLEQYKESSSWHREGVVSLGLEDDAVSLAGLHTSLSGDLLTDVEDLKKEIIARQWLIPNDAGSFEFFKKEGLTSRP